MNLKVMQLSVRADMGGGPRHVEHLLKAIHGQIECFVGCPADEPFFDIYSELLGDERIVTIPHRKITLSAIFSLLKFLKQNDIHIVHCHGKGASVYGRLLKIFRPGLKLIFTPNGIHVDKYSKITMALYVAFENMTSFLLNHLIYVSKSEWEKAKECKLYLHNKFSIIPNGVPIFSLAENKNLENLKSTLFKQADKKVIITFSRYDFQKNMQEAFEIATLLPQYNFLWLGHGEDFPALKTKMDQQQISNLNMLGVQKNVAPYLAISDMYLSTARWEGMPLALLEAMAAGIPILASNVTGNKDVINQYTGQLYELCDIADAVNKIKDIFESTQFDKEVVKDYFKNNFSDTKMASEVLKLYKQFA